jgi:hypothetical protein
MIYGLIFYVIIYIYIYNSCFIVVIVLLTDKMVDQFILVRTINRLVPVDFQVFILDEQVVDQFT